MSCTVLWLLHTSQTTTCNNSKFDNGHYQVTRFAYLYRHWLAAGGATCGIAEGDIIPGCTTPDGI